MLHEILLGLSGHPSPLFGPDAGALDQFPGLTGAEQSLLKALATVALAHRFLRRHTQLVSRSHVSVVCRAVAASIHSTHLGRFQQHVLDVERRILRQDASLVGAYNAVPLAAIVAEFEQWQRPMEWYCKVAVFMQAPDGPSVAGIAAGTVNSACSAGQLIDRLRDETRTGFAEIERIAVELGAVAESAWLRQVSSWVLYGRIGAVGSVDFFITSGRRASHGAESARTPGGIPTTTATTPTTMTSSSWAQAADFAVVSSLAPRFISAETVDAIFAAGRSLLAVKAVGDVCGASQVDVVADHGRMLAQVSLPLSDRSVGAAVAAIRQSFSRRVLRPLLPAPTIRRLLDLLHDFFLLARGEFAVCLVAEADRMIAQPQRPSSIGPTSAHPDAILHDADVAQILTRTLAALAAFSADDGVGDPDFDFARDLLLLQPHRPAGPLGQRSATIRTSSGSFSRLTKQAKHFHDPASFHDLLASPSAVALSLRLAAPLDLFLDDADVAVYSDVQAYLLAIRRAHLRLSGLSRLSGLRRAIPASRSVFGRHLTDRLRPVWAASSSAIFVLSGLMDYFADSVVRTGWADLVDQIGLKRSSDGPSTADGPPTTGGSTVDGSSLADSSTNPADDPEAIAAVHRRFLRSLWSALVLDDRPFTGALHGLLSDIDSLVSAIVRLDRVAAEVLATDDPSGGLFSSDLVSITSQLKRDRRRIQAGIAAVVGRLDALSLEDRQLDRSGFRMGTLDRLLLRLHFAGSGIASPAVDLESDRDVPAETDGRPLLDENQAAYVDGDVDVDVDLDGDVEPEVWMD